MFRLVRHSRRVRVDPETCAQVSRTRTESGTCPRCQHFSPNPKLIPGNLQVSASDLTVLRQRIRGRNCRELSRVSYHPRTFSQSAVAARDEGARVAPAAICAPPLPLSNLTCLVSGLQDQPVRGCSPCTPLSTPRPQTATSVGGGASNFSIALAPNSQQRRGSCGDARKPGIRG